MAMRDGESPGFLENIQDTAKGDKDWTGKSELN